MQAPPTSVLQVSELNREVRALLERGFPRVWIQGEISNYTRAASGHWYFSLKDDLAQVRCAMFKLKNMYLDFKPENGQQVLAGARISLYEPRGEFQLIVETLAPAGLGALQLQFEALKNRLAAEGLFESARKRPLPAWPRRIGVVTSPSGAAIHDILTVLRRRFPIAEILLYPTVVQGANAALQIASAIDLASTRKDCDVLIVGRGGGSLEDLWSFNEEIVVRAVAACAIPVVSAVGHEVDITLTDFVADVRAPTPSAAAELVAPDIQQWGLRFDALRTQLAIQIRRLISQQLQRLTQTEKRIQHPSRRLQQLAQRADDWELRLTRAMAHFLRMKAHRQQQAGARLNQWAPRLYVQQSLQQCERLTRRLQAAQFQSLAHAKQRWIALASALDAVSPLATLARGYAIVRRLEDGYLVRNAQAIDVGDRLEIRVSHGLIRTRVEEIEGEIVSDQ